MNTIIATSTPTPPSYNDSVQAHVNEHLPTSELLSLQLEGESVFAQGSGEILYNLTQAPLSGTGAVLGVEEVVYKPSSPDSEEPRVKTVMRFLYDVKAPKWAAVARSEHGAYGFEPQSGPTHCFSRGAGLLKGKRVIFFGRMGSTWRVWTAQKGLVVSLRAEKKFDKVRWRDEKGNVVAVESVVDSSSRIPVLELKMHLDKRTLNLLVTAWCAIIWHINRERRELETLEEHKKISK